MQKLNNTIEVYKHNIKKDIIRLDSITEFSNYYQETIECEFLTWVIELYKGNCINVLKDLLTKQQEGLQNIKIIYDLNHMSGTSLLIEPIKAMWNLIENKVGFLKSIITLVLEKDGK